LVTRRDPAREFCAVAVYDRMPAHHDPPVVLSKCPGLARLFDLPILDFNNPMASREARMNIHLTNADVVIIIALALLCSLLLALRFRPATWKGIVVEALAANAAAITAVVAFEMLLA
jgi:hypothetical protein